VQCQLLNSLVRNSDAILDLEREQLHAGRASNANKI
jgi:hypothetical protein